MGVPGHGAGGPPGPQKLHGKAAGPHVSSFLTFVFTSMPSVFGTVEQRVCSAIGGDLTKLCF